MKNNCLLKKRGNNFFSMFPFQWLKRKFCFVRNFMISLDWEKKNFLYSCQNYEKQLFTQKTWEQFFLDVSIPVAQKKVLLCTEFHDLSRLGKKKFPLQLPKL